MARRRPQREIAFSFDSFLDVVANVVGILLKLILVAWVGGRSYRAVMPTPELAPLPALAVPAAPPAPTDERQPVLVRRKRELGAHQKALVGKEAERANTRSVVARLRHDLEALSAKCRATAEQAATAREVAKRRARAARSVGLSEKQLREEADKLRAEAERLRRMPIPLKEFRYRTPISAAVRARERMFECKAGRVTPVETEALVGLVRADGPAQAERLRTQSLVRPATAPVGAFRLRYTLEREKWLPAEMPVGGGFRYALTRWEAEPVAPDRGEPAEEALAEGSAFRAVIDEIDRETTAVTLWVYPDSFALYRRLRDFLHDRDIVVAGRPLPDGVAIASSGQGTVSRGQ